MIRIFIFFLQIKCIQCKGWAHAYCVTTTIAEVKEREFFCVESYQTKMSSTLPISFLIDNRVHKRDRKRNNVSSRNTYISIGSLCVTS